MARKRGRQARHRAAERQSARILHNLNHMPLRAPVDRYFSTILRYVLCIYSLRIRAAPDRSAVSFARRRSVRTGAEE